MFFGVEMLGQVRRIGLLGVRVALEVTRGRRVRRLRVILAPGRLRLLARQDQAAQPLLEVSSMTEAVRKTMRMV